MSRVVDGELEVGAECLREHRPPRPRRRDRPVRLGRRGKIQARFLGGDLGLALNAYGNTARHGRDIGISPSASIRLGEDSCTGSWTGNSKFALHPCRIAEKMKFMVIRVSPVRDCWENVLKPGLDVERPGGWEEAAGAPVEAGGGAASLVSGSIVGGRGG
jgi:hypothetical protein